MNSESNTTVETQELLAISAEYIGMGTDAVVACRDRAIEPFGNLDNSDPWMRKTTGLRRRLEDYQSR
jgi:hypothetical protein